MDLRSRVLGVLEYSDQTNRLGSSTHHIPSGLVSVLNWLSSHRSSPPSTSADVGTPQRRAVHGSSSFRGLSVVPVHSPGLFSSPPCQSQPLESQKVSIQPLHQGSLRRRVLLVRQLRPLKSSLSPPPCLGRRARAATRWTPARYRPTFCHRKSGTRRTCATACTRELPFNWPVSSPCSSSQPRRSGPGTAVTTTTTTSGMTQ